MLENENINEPQNPAFLVGAVSGWAFHKSKHNVKNN